ncbi:hypothetical protein LMG24235_06228 [Paraburkholderia sabiae]|nr:hypothetical protein LMG24235_06228 [Paraburkholderia sabiae]
MLAARWCFLNFGFSKTSLDDIAKRASISRTLLYKTFRDKDDIFAAVFVHWLVARQPAAIAASRESGTPFQRLFEVCRLLVIEPWTDMVGAAMGDDFFDACERVDPETTATHHRIAHQCVAEVLSDEPAAEVFLLALDGLLADRPGAELLSQRVQILCNRFVQPTPDQKEGS